MVGEVVRRLLDVRTPAGLIATWVASLPMSAPIDPLPTLRRPGRHAVVIGHRGASADVPENTLPAFAAAWESGAPWVEADTQPTSDGVPVILHDDDLDRTTSGSG